MELYNEDNIVKKKSKIPMIIGICIVILTLITALIIYLIIYLQSTVIKISLDDVPTNKLEEIFYFKGTENGTKLYIPIRKIAKYLNYQDYSGDYKNKSEDRTKCHVQNEFETAMFTLDSNKLFKTRGDSDYETITIDEPVFEKDGELYTTIDGIKKAYNVEFLYNEEKRTIKIYTMDYLMQFYLTQLKILEYSEEFTDKKSIFENMIIVIQNDAYGVIEASTGKSILETKYESISYLPNTNEFLVKSNGKYGIISKDAKIKVKIAYDDIKIMDNENGLYLVKQNNLYGVIDTAGNSIIDPEYQQIGIDINKYAQNGIENQYIILNKLIPVKDNELWGFFDLKGKQIADFKYTNIGSKDIKETNSYPVLAIPSYEVIVVEINGYYNLMRLNATELINGYVVDSIYMKSNTVTGENTFYMTYNGKTENIEERLSSLGG